jgi:hypothetical protein
VYVRLAGVWADPTGKVHDAGDFVDIDAVTLARLEERGVVDNPGEDIQGPDWQGPGEDDEPSQPQWQGPGETDEDADDAEDEE